MSDPPCFEDHDEARRDGRAFGHLIGTAAAAAMIRIGSEPDRVRIAGIECAEMIVARAQQLARVDNNLTSILAWTEAAAAAFTEELDQLTALLLAGESRTPPIH